MLTSRLALALAVLVLPAALPVAVAAHGPPAVYLAIASYPETFTSWHEQRVGVLVTPHGEAPFGVRLSGSGPGGWNVVPDEDPFWVEPGRDRLVNVTLRSPALAEGEWRVDRIDIVARGTGPDALLLGAVHVDARATRLDAKVEPERVVVPVGGTANATLTIRNPGETHVRARVWSEWAGGRDIPETSWGWEPRLAGEYFHLAPYESKSWTVAFRLSAGWPWGANQTVDFDVALDGADGPTYARARLAVDLARGYLPGHSDAPPRDRPGPPVAYASPWATHPPLPRPSDDPARISGPTLLLPEPGSRTHVTLVVENRGWTPLDGHLDAASVGGAGWRVEPARTPLSLAPRESRVVHVNVTAPATHGTSASLPFALAYDTENGGGTYGRLSIAARVTERAAESFNFGVVRTTPRGDLPFASHVVEGYVASSRNHSMWVELTTEVFGDGFRAEIEPRYTWLHPGEIVPVNVTVRASETPPEVADAPAMLAVFAKEQYRPVETSWTTPLFWDAWLSDEERARLAEEERAEGTRLQATLVVAVALAGAAAAAGAVALAARRFESLRYLLLGALPLYTRLKRPEVLGHETRERLVAAITARPGVTLGELQAAFPIASGTLVHHLRTLERHKLVVSARDGPRRRFYAIGHRPAPLAAPPFTPAQLRVLALLAERPLTQRELAERLGVTKQAASQHLKALERAGAVACGVDGTWRALAAPEPRA